MLEFPGRAGELQRSGDHDALLDELATGYDAYHDYLRSVADGCTPSPDPAEFRARLGERRGFEAYIAAVADWQAVLAAEQLLRDALRRRTSRLTPGTRAFIAAQEGAVLPGLADAKGVLLDAYGPDTRVPKPPRTTDSGPGNLPEEILRHHRT